MSKPFVICLIDDDEIYKYTATKALKSQALAKKILVFSDGEEALDFLVTNLGNTTELPDLVFLDINMPYMDGFEFMEQYVKLKPRVGKKIVVYMVSSSVDPTDVDRAKSFEDVSDYIVKPIRAETMHEIVASFEKESAKR